MFAYYSMFEPTEKVRRQAGRRGIAGREERAARAVPLLALRGRAPAPDQPQPVSLELACELLQEAPNYTPRVRQ